MEYYEAKLSYKAFDQEKEKDVNHTSTYMVDAQSFTEAEAKVAKQAAEHGLGEYKVKVMKPISYEEVFNNNEVEPSNFEINEMAGEKWYKAKVQFDEGEGGKKFKKMYLAKGTSLENATKLLSKTLGEGSSLNMEVLSVTETDIITVVK